ncbi:hypothetical protein L1987_80399 [Smallanthus sonchifolius]|uniref:Uncharacterized protein n=1 Tax=Smallanthus sonchifolius TaxID=185202 RepID=A0ACB8YNS5_9ASTR|nr:hypothetical protein L1987_80399 [Smallanthus sonchifolius]
MIRGEERRRKGDQQITETLNKVHVLREVAEKAGATADVQRLLSLLEMLKSTSLVQLFSSTSSSTLNGSCSRSWIPSICSLLCSLGLIPRSGYKSYIKDSNISVKETWLRKHHFLYNGTIRHSFIFSICDGSVYFSTPATSTSVTAAFISPPL